jgi:leucine dehydrogenase
LLHVFGKFVDSLSGKYYTAPDVNTNASDLETIREVTDYAVGSPSISGNPSPFTARGIYMAMKAGASVRFGSESLKDKTVVVQGLGSVGRALCEHLHNEGAFLKVYDINKVAVEAAVKDLGAIALDADGFLTADCDIFSPCALGAVLNADNAKSLKCRMVAGAANNPLLDAATGDALDSMGILYLPDYIINSGGVINCGTELAVGGYHVDTVNAKVDEIYGTIQNIISLAKEKKVSTYRIADEYAESIVKRAKEGNKQASC